MTRASESDPTLTDVFGPEKARQLRWALWVRRQFTATSLTVIGLVAGSAWAYIGHLREQIAQVTTRVVVLETEVIPDKDLKLKVAEHEARLRNLEDNYQFARDHAADPPARGRVPR